MIWHFGQIRRDFNPAPPDSGRQLRRLCPVDLRFEFRQFCRSRIKDGGEMFPHCVGRGRLKQPLGGLSQRRAAQRGIAKQLSGDLISDFAPGQAERPVPEDEVEQPTPDLRPQRGAGNFLLTLIIEGSPFRDCFHLRSF